MKKRTKIILTSLVVLVVLVISFAKINRISPLSWGHQEVNTPLLSDEAINGYDPVSYFTGEQPQSGSETITHAWNNAQWHFASEANKELFMASPESYLPQFGGYCAFAVSKGFTANVDPNIFEMIDGKLYLFADASVRTDWLANQQENLAVCETNWK